MPNAFHKALHAYFSKVKRTGRSRPQEIPAGASPSPSRSSAASLLFSACRFPKTPSFALDRGGDHGIHHFNTLFLTDDSDHLPEFMSLSGSPCSSFSTDSVAHVPSDPASTIASHHFFVIPRTLDSVVYNSPVGAPATPESPLSKVSQLVGHGIAVATYSPDPFVDFRQSMQEMVEAREQERGIDWDFLEELLLCYLKLNHPRDHKFILGAFGDLLTCLAVEDQKPNGLIASATGVNCQNRRRKASTKDNSGDS